MEFQQGDTIELWVKTESGFGASADMKLCGGLETVETASSTPCGRLRRS